MRHFPIFLNVVERRVVVSGAGECAVSKLRLLLKTDANIVVIGADPVPQIRRWAKEGRLALIERRIEPADVAGAALVYGANDDEEEDARAAGIGRQAGALVNIVDNLNHSDFITPAIVDRDPVTVAIGTEGAAPVLARKIKADLEARLPASLGLLARIGQSFRHKAAMLPMGRKRRDFWSRYYSGEGDAALKEGGEHGAQAKLEELLTDSIETRPRDGHVSLIGTGPGDPELLTVKARRLIHEADVVLHDRLVPDAIIELARREAIIVEVGKTGYGPSWKQEDINALLVEHAANGAQVARLKSGDPGIFGRLDEELDALDEANISWDIVPGITAAAAAAASSGLSLTKRGRNSSIRFMTGRDVEGFAEHDWRDLAKSGSGAAIYMGVKAAAFLRGRLLIHGADAQTPVTIVENASRANQKTVSTTILALPDALAEAGITGPAVLLYGMAPRKALAVAAGVSPENIAEQAGAV
ncbi:siroheme synthase CysG [Oricola cellulosilytica]|uniref:Uroporphyrinogen-III C-methyltransferase n=1 Tax=Oricola cellulosilytica TaxID=1429082 RepID=A0A4R0P8W6_9HYPH|nr:siroheme synthase CysG [Oricola cellulosilytica]TCD13513.1 uroporphyrinogen-III C-methyltransferase [Oricola cellulosilytica]